jgi:hypothetical protein
MKIADNTLQGSGEKQLRFFREVEAPDEAANPEVDFPWFPKSARKVPDG